MRISTSGLKLLHEVVYGSRSKLFIFGETKTWRKRVIGEARIIRHNEHQRLRFVMREEKTIMTEVIANHAIEPRIELKLNTGSDRSWVSGVHLILRLENC